MNLQTEIAAGIPPTAASSDDSVDLLPDIRAKEPVFMEVFFAWEKLRILLNLIAAPVAILFLALRKPQIPLGDFVAALVEVNIFFCVGIFVEGYCSWLGIRRTLSRLFTFILLLLGMLYAFWSGSVLE